MNLRLFQWLWWNLRGRPKKTHIGGVCGCCGKYVSEAKFEYPDYQTFDASLLGDAVTVCNSCGGSQSSSK